MSQNFGWTTLVGVLGEDFSDVLSEVLVIYHC